MSDLPGNRVVMMIDGNAIINGLIEWGERYVNWYKLMHDTLTFERHPFIDIFHKP